MSPRLPPDRPSFRVRGGGSIADDLVMNCTPTPNWGMRAPAIGGVLTVTKKHIAACRNAMRRHEPQSNTKLRKSHHAKLREFPSTLTETVATICRRFRQNDNTSRR